MGGPGTEEKNQRDGRVTSIVKVQFFFLFCKIDSFGRHIFFWKIESKFNNFL